MIDLDDPIWSTLRHAGGPASHYPSVLRRLGTLVERNELPEDELLEDMWDVCRQLTTYDATLAAVPHLIELCGSASPDQPIRKFLLDLIGYSVASIRSDGIDEPSEIVHAFDLSLARLQDLTIATLPYATNRTEMCRLFGTFAVSTGDYAAGLLMYELPQGSLQCKECKAFNSPFESSLNPLSGE